jgi:hypothetical protein
MTASEYEKLPTKEKEHFMECPECGEMFDRRSLDEVLFSSALAAKMAKTKQHSSL